MLRIENLGLIDPVTDETIIRLKSQLVGNHGYDLEKLERRRSVLRYDMRHGTIKPEHVRSYGMNPETLLLIGRDGKDEPYEA